MMSDSLKKSLGMLEESGSSLDKVETQAQKRKRQLAESTPKPEPVGAPEPEPEHQRSGVVGDELEQLLMSGMAESNPADEGEDFKPPEPIEPFELKEKSSQVAEFEQSDVTDDYNRTRAVTYSTQDACITMMARAMQLAAETENPRAFAVFNDLVSNVRGLNKDLMDTQKTFHSITQDKTPKRDPEAEGNPDEGANKQQGATLTVPLGSNTANLLKMLEQAESDLQSDSDAINGEVEEAEIEE